MKYPDLARVYTEKAQCRQPGSPQKSAILPEHPRWPEDYLSKVEAFSSSAADTRMGCTFTKSCQLPPGVINYDTRAPLETLSNYGDWSMLAVDNLLPAGSAVGLVGGSLTAEALSSRLGGSIAIRGAALITASSTALAGVVALLFPRSLGDPGDPAFYIYDQYAKLDTGRVRVRLGFRHLSDGAVDAYGVYSGRRDWEMVKVVRAEEHDGTYIAQLGAVELVWIPDEDVSGALVTPPPDTSKIPHVWVYPDGEAIERVIGAAVEPASFEDFIVWFPGEIAEPIYIAINMSSSGYHPAPKDGLPGFPEAIKARPKTHIQGGGGLRARWKDPSGNIYEWDSRHGRVEMYNRKGLHLGEFDPVTGEQTKDADKSRKVEP